MFLAQSSSNLTYYSHASADSMHISIFTMNSILCPPSVIDQGCDAVIRQRTHAITSRLALPSSMFMLVAYPVCRMCTKISRLVTVHGCSSASMLIQSKHHALRHIFPLQLTNDCEWHLGLYMQRPTWSLQKIETNC